MASIRKKVKTLDDPSLKGKRRGIIIKRRQAFLSELAAAYSDVLNDEGSSKRRRSFFRKPDKAVDDYDSTFDVASSADNMDMDTDLEKTIRITTEESEAINQVSFQDRMKQLGEKLEPAKEWTANAWASVAAFFSDLWAKIPKPEKQEEDEEERTPGIFKKRTKKPNYVFSIAATTIKMLAIVVLVIAFAGTGALIGVADAYMNTAPDLDTSAITAANKTSYIYDRNGDLITEYMDTENRDWVPIEQIPDMMKNAVIAVEDVRFNEHEGVDVKRIVGSFVSNMTSNTVEGGSTITQQLIKNYMLTNERSYRRKIQEAYLAIELEDQFSKDDILETYINKVHYGEKNYGVKSASVDYFHKENLNDLTIRECAMLAGVINNATKYNPRKNYYDTKNRPEGRTTLDTRTNTVLRRMFTAGYITSEQYEQALKEDVTVFEEPFATAELEYPEFVEYAIESVIDMFLKQRNLENTSENRTSIKNELKVSGYRIYTTLDPDVQDKLENVVYNWDKYPTIKNSEKYGYTTQPLGDGTTARIQQPQVAAAIIDYKTGHVVALVGGRKKPDAIGMSLNRAIDSRQPVGSSIKPIAVYAPAIETMNLGTATAIQNIEGPVAGWNINSPGAKRYPGANGTKGGRTMKEAIVGSQNLCAARTLMELMGDNYEKNIQTSLQFLKDMGISDEALEPTGSGLALGTNGMTVIEEAGAYGTIANGGLFMQPVGFTEVRDSNEKLILEASKVHDEREVFRPSTAWMMIDMLTEAVNSGTGKNARISGLQVAGKTGTNDEHRGITFAGMTPFYSCAVWVGHDDYKPMTRVFGGDASGAAPLWQSIMSSVHEDLDTEGAQIMDETAEEVGLDTYAICRVSGLQAGNGCGQYKAEGYFLKGTQPIETCDWHRSASMCSETGMKPGPYCKVTSGNYIGIPEDAPIRSIGIENLRRHYPYGGPSGQQCTKHTHEWYITEGPGATPIEPEQPIDDGAGVVDLGQQE